MPCLPCPVAFIPAWSFGESATWELAFLPSVLSPSARVSPAAGESMSGTVLGFVAPAALVVCWHTSGSELPPAPRVLYVGVLT